MLGSLVLAILPLAVIAAPAADSTSSALSSRQQRQISWSTEYSTQCKTCPYTLCPNIAIERSNITATCWTDGENIVDTTLWLRTIDDCYVTEYDLEEYPGDFRDVVDYCGKVPFKITKQSAEVKYLSVGKWSSSTSAESIKFYGRDKDLTLTCWKDGNEILGNPFWYKTTDNCHVSETGLYDPPDRSTLDYCGPSPGPRMNESEVDSFTAKKTLPHLYSRPASADEKIVLTTREEQHQRAEEPRGSIAPRWLQEGLIGEEYAPCRSCASDNSTCRPEKVYKYNQTVVSQCVANEDIYYPNGTFKFNLWMLTTDWCYVHSDFFWEPPYDHYRYPNCANWGY